mmetsp:Transcript_10700/g.16070  ORF Transcript_10700/g.16070 Transcript_10700/m.16070 type:complete len:209 (-) Transcript_10700:1618-2244(-)
MHQVHAVRQFADDLKARVRQHMFDDRNLFALSVINVAQRKRKQRQSDTPHRSTQRVINSIGGATPSMIRRCFAVIVGPHHQAAQRKQGHAQNDEIRRLEQRKFTALLLVFFIDGYHHKHQCHTNKIWRHSRPRFHIAIAHDTSIVNRLRRRDEYIGRKLVIKAKIKPKNETHRKRYERRKNTNFFVTDKNEYQQRQQHKTPPIALYVP